MIVRRRGDEFVLVTQQDHAQLSGWLAALWGNEAVPELPEPKAALCLAAAMHDAGWPQLDESPLWNPEAGAPFSFLDLPAAHRFDHYTAGLDLVEEADHYAALLCSHFYAALVAPALATEGSRELAFYRRETTRQERLMSALQVSGRTLEVARLDRDLSLLRLLDALSLYVALNEPGVSKEREHPWFRAGFPPYTPAGAGQPITVNGYWLDERRVALRPFPLRESLSYALPYRVVTEEAIKRLGLLPAYRAATWRMQVISFVACD